MEANKPFMKNVTEAIRTMQHAVHKNAVDHGWWEGERSDGELIALQHAELSECLEALRDGNQESEKLPGFCCAEEEYLRGETYWSPSPKYLEIEDGEIIVCYGKRREKREKNKRTSPEYKRWRTKVFQRDNYTCQRCNAKGVELNAHHIKPYQNYPELRLDNKNGITLCKVCHKYEHAKR